MKYCIRRVFLFISLMLLTVVQAWAGEITTGDISVEVLPNNSGNIVEVISAVPNGDMTKVTIKVTKAGTYTINEDLITVVPMVKLPQQARRRAPGFAGSLPVHPVIGEADQYYFEVSHVDYDGAYITARFVESTSTTIYSLSEITNLNGQYTLGADISGGEVPAEVKTGFTGSLNGNYHKIYNLSEPLFESTDGAHVYNLMLEDVSINGSGNVGAITKVANGATRIYNCGILSGSVSGSEKVGGLVGLLDGTSRVINCFSYADVLGGTNKGGIVGYNNGTTTSVSITTMVMNCMFYGDICSGGNISPVYGGNLIDNLQENNGLNTFNYYRYESPYSKNGNITDGKYNCALAVEEEYLTRVEIYRQLLNSNRKLAAYYALGDADKGYGKDNEMAKWVLETADQTNSNPKPYPVLKAQGYYHSIVNYDAENAPQTPENIKSLTINVGSSPLRITDKDPDHYNFNYHKVQLPYYTGTDNYKLVNGVYKVVTGWEVTVGDNTKAIAGTDISSDGQKPYNFADRNCTIDENNNKRVYSQGAYFDVPEGVSSITLTPHWANAVFVADAKLDRVYNSTYNLVKIGDAIPKPSDVISDGYKNGTSYAFNYEDGEDGKITLKVYTNITTAINNLPSATSVYDNAVVLVGNLHLIATPSTGTNPFTIMSADFDKDHEPDFSLIYTHARRNDGAVSPIRFDFLNMPGMAMAQKPNGSDVLRNVSIFKPKGWFEVTNTCLVHFVQFEYDDGGKTVNIPAPVILLGGVYDQFVSTQSSKLYNESTKQPNTSYIHVGSNAWFKEFGNGTHSDGFQFTPHIPISVTGGDYQKFYLSGTYRPDAIVMEDNAECYISGGRFGELAGAGQQQIDGNVNWFIDYADIDEFYGGGINAGKPITGDITIDIKKSNVKFFCGGPKFGDMQKKGIINLTWAINASGTQTGSRNKEINKDREVTTDAEKCTFGNFYGAGYGGNSYYRVRTVDHSQTQGIDWNSWQSAYTDDRGKYITNNNGIPTDFDYEYFIGSDGVIWGRFYVQNASFSMAQTNNVTSTLNNCEITGDYYGGGCRGRVDGKATSTLIDCTVNGNVFGGGYSASVPTISVRSSGFTTIPSFNSDAGVFNDGVFSTSNDYTWAKGTLTNGSSALNGNYITTDVDLSSLGQVKETDLKIQGNTTVSGLINGSPTGGAFGGGDASAVYENTKVTISAIGDNKPTIPNVFGGGNSAGVYQNAEVELENGTITNIYGGCNTIGTVGGNTSLQLTGGTVAQNVFGGGKGQPTLVNGHVTVNVGKLVGSNRVGSAISGDVYGGSALGNVNAKTDDQGNLTHSGNDGESKPIATKVNLIGGTVTGSVYGGGLGQVADAEHNVVAVAANVYGPVTVTTTGGTATNVFGCNDLYGAPQSTVNVNIEGGNITSNVFGGGNLAAYTGSPVVAMSAGTANNVFGGGLGSTAIVTGNTSVTLSGSGAVTHDVYGGGSEADVTGNVSVSVTGGRAGTVYGGGALAHTNTANWDPTSGDWATGMYNATTGTQNTTTVSLTGGTIVDVYGGGLGEGSGTTGTPAYVYGDVTVDLNGSMVGTTPTPIDVNATKGCVVNRIFGCNNINGSPKGEVMVHVYATQSASENNLSTKAKLKTEEETSEKPFDVQDIYGGGNVAEYWPVAAKANGEGETETNHIHTNVIIDGCDLTSIKRVFGGGNAASTPSTKVTVNGTYEIDEIFGGGNGEGTGPDDMSQPAHVGFHHYTDEADKDANIYGFGKAEVIIGGGTINYIYGAGNQNGNVREVAIATLDNVGDCEFNVGKAYGGGKKAPIDGRAILNLGCVNNVGDVYGGAEAADIHNDIELNITNGTYGKVFGGNNISGNIYGKIVINIEETGCQPININELYIGGNLAKYSVYGYKAPNDPKSSADGAKVYADPILNVKSFTHIGNIYGGGYQADLYGDPEININQVPGDKAALIDADNDNTADGDANALGTIGNVYGGGNAADIYGNTNVNIGTKTTIDYISKASGESTPRTAIPVKGVNITGNIYGGGQGSATNVTGNVNVNVGSTTATAAVKGNTIICGNVYGGSAYGKVNKPSSGETTTSTTKIYLYAGTIRGSVYGGGMGVAPAANVTAISAEVWGDTEVEMHGDMVTGALYGGCDQNGVMKKSTKVSIIGGTLGTAYGETPPVTYPDILFGGGFGPNTSVVGNVEVNVGSLTGTTTPTIWGSVYGGSAKGSVNNSTSNTTKVNLYKGTVNGDVYGGGLGDADNAAVVNGNIRVNLNGDADNPTGTGECIVTGRIFGCNNANGSPKGDAEVHIYKTVGTGTNVRSVNKDNTAYDLTHVFGGGNKATFNTGDKIANVIIETCDVSIKEVYGGGYGADVPNTQVEVKGAYEIGTVFGGGYGAGSSHPTAADYNPGANVNGSTDVILKGGVIHEVYGGSNTKGNIVVGSNVNVSDGQGCCDLKVDNIYGGGRNASMEGGTSIVLGCQPNTWIEDIYAGSREADVDGDVELTITSGKFKRVFGGNKTSGKLKGSIKVNIEETGNCGTPIIIGELYAGGNEADYSIYGYKDDGTPMTADELRTRLTTENPGKTTAQIEELFQAAKKNEPQLNVRAFTSIGAIYGGGYSAKMYADPTVSINVVKGSHYNDDALEAGSTPALAGITPATTLPYPAHAKGAIGAIGNVFGGGNLATVYGSTTVNIGTETTVGFKTEPIHLRINSETPLTKNTETGLYDITVEGANITGNVYGGGRLADVTGNTNVNICAKYNTTSEKWESVSYDEGRAGVTIGSAGVTDKDHGNVFGGGKGVAAETGARAFYCEEAMIGEEGTNSFTKNNDPAYADYGTHVRIGNGTVNGSVYGGGEIGRVEFNTEVVIGLGEGTGAATKSPVINGSVFGAGKGTNTHGYSGLVRGDSKVTVQADAKIGQSVYGGGEMASVGKYEVVDGLPKTPKFGGKCTVTIQGYAEIGPDNMQMTKEGGPDDTGHVFGAGKGTLPYENVTGTPWSMQTGGKVTYDESYTPGTDGLGYEAAYYKFIQSLGLASNTYVTIGGQAFVKGSVYGGSENGYLQADSHVTISGGQIGEGLNKTAPYADADFIDPSTTPVTIDKALATCATWTYDKITTGKPYDKYAAHLNSTDNEYYYDAEFTKSSKGGAPVATDGHTYYGNVFGGGRGVVPFAAGKWHRAAGSVAGNTQVDITAGHILSSVYGGNENTDVGSYALGTDGEPTTTLSSGGTCTINITGGTVGVPRTKEQIEDNPVIGNVFGAGKGDKRVLFNTWTNVGTTSVNISGDAKIYGSVFGGGEDGHVINNAVTSIGGTVTTGTVATGTTNHTYSKVVIGSTGISGADGNVFGGGRGSETALTAGVVGGNANLTINKGIIMGNVYGGGRLASVGTNFTNPTLENGDPDPRYGELQTPDADHGNIIVTVNDGTIGSSTSTGVNGNIFGGSKGTETNWKLGIARSTTVNMTGGTAYASVYGGGELAQVVGGHTTSDQTLGTEINISGGTIGISGKGEATWGNVYGGGKGNTTHVEAGLVKTNTKVAVSETDATNHPTLIYHNIYGGGAYGSVGEFNYDATTGMPTGRVDNTTGGKTEVYVTGGTIGTNGKENGMVFGSSRGDVGAPGAIHDKLAWVYDTHVAIGDTTATTINTATPLIKGSVYGGGENGHNLHSTYVRVNGGTIGIDDTSDPDGGANYEFRGNVYGGGCGTDTYSDGGKTYFNRLAGTAYGNTTVNVTGGHIVRNVYGGGAMGSVGTFTRESSTDPNMPGKITSCAEGTGICTVKVSGGKIGPAVMVMPNTYGNVFGAGRGEVHDLESYPNLERVIYVDSTYVEISDQAFVKGSVYGGSESGHMLNGTYVKIAGGQIGCGKNADNADAPYTDWDVASLAECVHWAFTADEKGLPYDKYANDYDSKGGAPIGTDGHTFYGNVFGGGSGSVPYAAGKWLESAGVVGGNTKVEITGGHILTSVYGGCEVTDVKKGCIVTMTGGTVGVPRAKNEIEAHPVISNIFGAGKGDKRILFNTWTNVDSTKVTVTGGTVYGSVYGGGEDGHVLRNARTIIGGNAIIGSVGTSGNDGNVFGGGRGSETALTAGVVGGNTYLTIENGTMKGSVYGGGRLASVGTFFAEANDSRYGNMQEDVANGTTHGHIIVNINGGTIGAVDDSGNLQASDYSIGDVFGSCKGTMLRYTASSEDMTTYKYDKLGLAKDIIVNMNGGAVNGTIYGGGESGDVQGSVSVSMTGGTVKKDVYGGGALADTQINNWSGTTWAEGKTSASSTTTVNLLGGTIGGDAYGGGLGRLEATGVKAIEAMVYGDVSLNLGKANDDTTPATAFNISKYDGKDIVKSGRLFGCNNLNGTPKGNVTVTVNKTVAGNVTRTAITRDSQTHKVTNVGSPHTYEVAAVYGGGNLANYIPKEGAVKVIINGCDVSIEEVYGGGNAAEVPATDVLVLGAHQIEQVFGGGNGADNYTLDGGTTWNVNPGANVNGNANTLLKGGLIHEAYGGSNEKGTITGNITIDTGSGGLANCPVQVDKLVGAGKNADVNGNMYIILGCKDATLIPIVYGGADNANVNGNVELTITSGHFGKVFGGNNLGGAIRGHIVLNIEETSDCEPIRIDELYLGGNQAAYSKYGYYVKTTTSESNDATGVGAPTETAVLDEERLIFMPRQSAEDKHKPVKSYSFDENTQEWSWEVYPESGDGVFEPYTEPVLNIVSCTEIKEVFGGGYGEGGDMYANPTVNINMIPGRHAERELGGAHELGVIGDVYGGGNAADVVGNTTLNIGTEQTVRLHQDVDKETGIYTMSDPINVEGANIIGNVYGGGKLANVGKYHTVTESTVTTDVIDAPGNTYVNIGVKKGTDDTYSAMTFGEGAHGITIASKTVGGQTVGGNVFGGGKGEAANGGAGAFRCGKAMVTGGTNVIIGNGTVSGTVYGGGEVGRVENGTVVTIGLGSGTEEGARTPVIGGSVFGAGKGVSTHGYSALVRGKAIVTVQGNAQIGHSVYGGGEIASIGRYNVADAAYHAAHPEVEIGMPYALADPENLESGKCVVIVKGYAEIGPDDMKMTAEGGPDDTGYVFGAGKGVLPYKNTDYSALVGDPWRMTPGNSQEKYTEADFGAGYEDAYLNYIKTLALATETDVTITEHAFVKGSVYGGSENGHVQHDTHVTIDGYCQIGNGFNPETQKGVNRRYTDAEWAYDGSDEAHSLKECASWPYEAPYAPYDVYDLDVNGKPKHASDGHTFYGNVFGGGSGYFPYSRDPNYTEERKTLGYSDGRWLRSAGAVYGNTVVDIKGGHILTSVYGGNECTDVSGTTTVKMSGGTLGVPRTVEQMKAHPVTCYLFGAGKGDQRINFNTWTNVEKAIVNITGGHIFGSVFGGGEDGHVLGDVEMKISGDNTVIGTTGTSYVDGNIFGGGRGFSGDAQTAGTVGGNITLNISSGTMLGSVYGGGRLASVGTSFTAPEDPNYGNFVEDAGGKTYGHVTINISGGTIGNGTGNSVIGDVSGNVFGGSMGRLTLLNGGTNPIWPKMAQVKSTEVNISGNALIKRTVYGGGELGTVRDNTHVTISGGQVNRDVYGGGYGSEDDDLHTIFNVKEPDGSNGYIDNTYAFTPMQFAGCVGKSTTVDVSGGYIRKSVYGGGEMASVGIMNCLVEEVTSEPGKDKIVVAKDNGKWTIYKNMRKHWDVDKEFALSWPIEFSYVPTFDGATHINITGGRIGTTTADDYGTDNGDVYGGGKGFAGDYNDYVFCANVGSTDVNINYTSGATTLDPAAYMSGGDCIAGAVYGGGENGHVMGDTHVTLTNGLIGHGLYGGGSGKGQFTVKLKNIGAPASSTIESNPDDFHDATIYSILAGKVFGNTKVDMSGGYVVRNVYGGGTMGSVGKGNYAGGTDDYSTTGYGENAGGNLWTSSADGDNAWQFLNSGICTVNITGGTVGYTGTKDGLPYGNVFGGCRGEAAPNIVETPRYLYSPEFFVGYANETRVTIGAEGSTTGPRILGSVYGGGQDGHVRRDAKVTINSGEIGSTYTGDGTDLNNIEWLHSGNVYGAGSGIGKYQFDFNHDGDFDDVVDYNNGRSTVATKETDYSTSAGSVTRFTTVDIKGGTIHRNVYGGGSLSSIGAPKIPVNGVMPPDPYHPNRSTEVGKLSLNEVIISGGTIGDVDGVANGYGGDVNGGSRGDFALGNSFSTSIWTDVTISGSADIKGNVFGGGEAGLVKQDTEVKMQGGTVGNDLYGGGDLADVGGNTVVDMTGGTIQHDAYGGARGTADVAAEVKGNATVTLDGTKFIPAFDTNGILTGGRIFGANNVNGTPKGHIKVHVLQTVDSAKDPSVALADRTTYDVGAVYGGGNNADYKPTSTTEYAEVIIDGCEKTSIKYVFGGGNAAATPANEVMINGCYIIDNVFGGGNGTVSPANVGYDEADYKTMGTAKTNLSGGYIHNVYGGSNNQGNILGGASVTNEKHTGEGCCDNLQIQEIYGGGKKADMFGGAEIVLGCMPDDWIGAIYAGAEKADVGGDVGLTLTSGKFERVFGGNKSGGKINGYIEVNIEENPECGTPIIIGELYGGGNEAPYTIPAEYGADYLSPRVNVRAFTSIGTIFGGGLGATATVTGNPWVNINEVAGGREYAGETRTLEDGTKVTLYERKADGKMGVIGTVFGGGNAAPVIGNPRVEIGTAAKQKMLSLQTKDADGITIHEVEKDVLGADIRGNVYGGGNNATVTGDPKVVIGQKK